MLRENISFQPTGDPFVDAGGMALEYIAGQFPEKNLMELIEWAARIYVERWGTKLNSVFHGSPITHPTTAMKVRIPKNMELFKEILSSRKNPGYCRYCGREDYLIDAGRDKSCLSGSGTLVNFHHSHEPGLMICPQCAIKYFFLPFGILQMGNLALLQATSPQGKRYWLNKTVIENLNKIGNNTSEGILKSVYSNPENALFRLAADFITENLPTELEENLTLYYFTNFAASVDCVLYTIPSPVFRFMRLALKNCPQQWYLFVRRYYHISKSRWNYIEDQWEKKGSVISEDEYLNHKNDVHLKLLAGKSILSALQHFYKANYLHAKQEMDSIIAIYYVQEVLNMQKEQIMLIKKIGSKIFELMDKESNYKKYLVMIEGSTRAYQLRSALIKIIKTNYQNGAEEPVFTMDEYVNYLFPDGQYWGEVRDLLLIFLYEKLHQNAINVTEISDVELKETEEISQGA
ncbi:MAG: type I-B CRISPR-associated protein Cas8b1/Cst1 [Candidatus Marinimicrobia bacterium]|nr:type I-B CRISPR-associated protein Cas8b1/Cst1 [Candidatus Neomarinimicrobiota bacterium]